VAPRVAATTSRASTNLVTANDVWARLVIKQLDARVDDPVDDACARLLRERRARALHGACVQRGGHRATAVWGDSPDDERRDALRDLAAGACNVVFSVDLFNEGVDVPGRRHAA
jgi:hypothetical protein